MSVMEKTKSASEEPLRYCLYARKSSEADERQAMSIDSQVAEMHTLAQRDKIEIVETIRESKSAKASGGREGYIKLIQGLHERRYNAILCWAPDRLSRNAGDLGILVDLMDQGMLKKVQAHGQSFTNTPDEKFLLMILCSQAKLENDNRAKNVKRGLRSKCSMGMRPGAVPLGYKLVRSSENLSEPSKIVIDEERAPFIKKIFEYITEGNLSGRQVWECMEDEGFRSKTGKTVTLSMIFRILKTHFYYGRFEYPKGSGSWYDGSHEPLITKETFEKAQKKLEVCDKGQWGRKQFYFNRIFKCAHCGSGISGEEHINRHGKKYTYYKCNKYGGKGNCKTKYIREEKLLEEMVQIIHKVTADSVHLSRKLKHDVDMLNDWERKRYGDKAKEMTPHEFLCFTLERGNAQEKTAMLRCIKGQLMLEDGQVVLKN